MAMLAAADGAHLRARRSARRSSPSKTMRPLVLRAVDEAEHRQRGDRLARARLADERELLAGVDRRTRRRRRPRVAPKRTVRCSIEAARSAASGRCRERARRAAQALGLAGRRRAAPLQVARSRVAARRRGAHRVELRLQARHHRGDARRPGSRPAGARRPAAASARCARRRRRAAPPPRSSSCGRRSPRSPPRRPARARPAR